MLYLKLPPIPPMIGARFLVENLLTENKKKKAEKHIS